MVLCICHLIIELGHSEPICILVMTTHVVSPTFEMLLSTRQENITKKIRHCRQVQTGPDLNLDKNALNYRRLCFVQGDVLNVAI